MKGRSSRKRERLAFRVAELVEEVWHTQKRAQGHPEFHIPTCSQTWSSRDWGRGVRAQRVSKKSRLEEVSDQMAQRQTLPSPGPRLDTTPCTSLAPRSCSLVRTMARVALGSGKSVGAGGGGKLWGREEGTWGRMGTARVDVCMYFSVRVPPSFSLCLQRDSLCL